MSVIGWFDKPRGLSVAHLAASALFGLAVGFVCAVGLSRDPVSRLEIRDLYVIPRPNLAFPDRLNFGPYVCEEYCEGHLAGWDWGLKNDVKSRGDCEYGTSTSFQEGCLFYLQVRGLEKDEW